MTLSWCLKKIIRSRWKKIPHSYYPFFRVVQITILATSRIVRNTKSFSPFYGGKTLFKKLEPDVQFHCERIPPSDQPSCSTRVSEAASTSRSLNSSFQSRERSLNRDSSRKASRHQRLLPRYCSVKKNEYEHRLKIIHNSSNPSQGRTFSLEVLKIRSWLPGGTHSVRVIGDGSVSF